MDVGWGRRGSADRRGGDRWDKCRRRFGKGESRDIVWPLDGGDQEALEQTD